jgi:hypothetical protein
MIYLHHARIVILSQPKTGTTALDNALASRASIAATSPPQLKHLPYHRFMTFVAPWIEAQTGATRADYEVVSVMREPVSWLGSWYRYRTREALKKGVTRKKRKSYTGNVTFEEFVIEALKPPKERQMFAKVGVPCSVAYDADGGIGCDRIFPYEDLSGLYGLIEERLGKPVELKELNVSPPGDTALSDEALARLKSDWAFAFDLHSSLTTDGRLDARFKAARDTDGEDEADIT